MALHVDSPAAGGNLGPGYAVEFHTDILPVPVDEIVRAQITPVGFSGGLEGYSNSSPYFAAGSGHWLVQLGLGTPPPGQLAQKFPIGVSQEVAGTACNLVLTQWHANGTFVDQTVQAGTWSWDGENKLWRLVVGLIGIGSTGDIAAILAAVTRTYSNH